MSQRLSFLSQPEKLWQVKPDSIYTVGDAGITESPNLNEKPCSFLCPRSELCLFGQSWIVELTFGISPVCLWCPPWPLALLLHVSPLLLWYCHHSAHSSLILKLLFLALSHFPSFLAPFSPSNLAVSFAMFSGTWWHMSFIKYGDKSWMCYTLQKADL